MATLWFFIWGVVVLTARISGVQQTDWLALGILDLSRWPWLPDGGHVPR